MNDQRGGTGTDPGEWWGAIDGEILACLGTRGAMTPAEICRELGMFEGEAISFLAMLAREGKVRICQVERAA